MKNTINYYYNLYPDEILLKDGRYNFTYEDNKYVLEPYKRPLDDALSLYKLNQEMIQKNIFIHEIIMNNDHEILTYVNNDPYILIKLYVNENKKTDLSEVVFINNNATGLVCDETLRRSDWVSLWEAKNDYFESQITEIEKRFPIICGYANYYIGLSENAISYVNNALKENDFVRQGACHKRISSNDTLYELYHPLTFVYDYSIRDIAEYVKSAFFNEEDAYNIVYEYFINNRVSYKEALLFYARLLYPSYFFDMYDDIVNENLSETLIDKYVNKADDYEMFLLNVYIFLTKFYNRYIIPIDWIIKRSYI